jgi:signal transduction histidine kinase
LTISFIVIVVFLVNLVGWFFYLRTRKYFLDELDKRLLSIVSITSTQLEIDYISLLTPGDENSFFYQKTQKELREIVSLNHLKDLFILDQENCLLISSEKDAKIGDEYFIFKLDLEELVEAWRGVAKTSPLCKIDNAFYKNAYFPLKNKKGETVAVLVARTEAAFLKGLNLIKPTLFFLGIISLVLVILLGSFFSQLVKLIFSLEASARRADKLSTIGQIASGVAHEVKNPLSVIRSGLELLQDDVKTELIPEMIEEVDRLDQTIQNFLQYARLKEVALEKGDLNEIIEAVLKLSSYQLKKGRIKVQLNLEKDLPPFWFDRRLMKQVLLNLVLNAQEAMKEGGEIIIKTAKRGKKISLSIKDTGEGIERVQLKKIFDPFFTTKKEGTGLGLFIANSIIRQHCGEIKVESKKGEGTKFEIILPERRKK